MASERCCCGLVATTTTGFPDISGGFSNETEARPTTAAAEAYRSTRSVKMQEKKLIKAGTLSMGHVQYAAIAFGE